MTDDTKQKIESLIKDNTIALFMKGTPDFPQCGFSAGAVECLQRVNASFGALNVLEHQDVREGVKEFSNWPTIPQIYIKGEFIGGFDILREMYMSGELEKRVKEVGAAA